MAVRGDKYLATVFQISKFTFAGFVFVVFGFSGV